MDKNQIREVIAKRVAKELKNGDVVNLGIGPPTLVPNYLPEDIELILQSEMDYWVWDPLLKSEWKMTT